MWVRELDAGVPPGHEGGRMNLTPEQTLQRLEKCLEMHSNSARAVGKEEITRDLGYAVAWGEIELANLQNRMGDDPDQ
jgi:hypothetical protein